MWRLLRIDSLQELLLKVQLSIEQRLWSWIAKKGWQCDFLDWLCSKLPTRLKKHIVFHEGSNGLEQCILDCICTASRQPFSWVSCSQHVPSELFLRDHNPFEAHKLETQQTTSRGEMRD